MRTIDSKSSARAASILFSILLVLSMLITAISIPGGLVETASAASGHDGDVIAASSDGGVVYLINADTGDIIWETSTQCDAFIATDMNESRYVLASGQCGLYLLDPDGNVVMNTSDFLTGSSSLSIRFGPNSEYAYVGSDIDGKLSKVALNSSGTEVWSTTLASGSSASIRDIYITPNNTILAAIEQQGLWLVDQQGNTIYSNTNFADPLSIAQHSAAIDTDEVFIADEGDFPEKEVRRFNWTSGTINQSSGDLGDAPADVDVANVGGTPWIYAGAENGNEWRLNMSLGKDWEQNIVGTTFDLVADQNEDYFYIFDRGDTKLKKFDGLGNEQWNVSLDSRSSLAYGGPQPFSTEGLRLTYQMNSSYDISTTSTINSEGDHYRRSVAIDPTTDHFWSTSGHSFYMDQFVVDEYDKSGSHLGGIVINGVPRGVDVHGDGVSSSGGLWITYGSVVAEYDSGGTEVTNYDISGTVGTPRGVAVDGEELWVIGDNDLIYKFYTNGTYSGTSFNASALNGAKWLDVGPEKRFIWVANGSHAGRFYQSNGTFLTGSAYDFKADAVNVNEQSVGFAVEEETTAVKGTTDRKLWWQANDGINEDDVKLRRFDEYIIPDFAKRCTGRSDVWGADECHNPAINGSGPVDEDKVFVQWERSGLDPNADMTLDTDTGTLYVPHGSTLYAINQTSGENRWTKDLGGTVGSPVIVGNEIYVSGNDTIYALDKTNDGSTIWSTSVGQSIYQGGLDYLNNRLSFAAGEQWVYAVNASDGSIAWSEQLDSNGTSARGVDLYQGHQFDANVSLAISGDGRFTEFIVYAIYLNNGTRMWTYSYGTGSNKALAGLPIGQNDTMFFPTSVNQRLDSLNAFDIWRARPMWSSGAGWGRKPAVYEPEGMLYHTYQGGLSGGLNLRAWDHDYLLGPQISWESSLGDPPTIPSDSTPAITQDRIFAYSLTDNSSGRFSYLDVRYRSNGSRQYRLFLDGNEDGSGIEIQSPIVNGSQLFFGDSLNSVYAISEDVNESPIIYNGTASPQNRTSSPGRNATLAVNVSDPNFDGSGDELTVDFYLNGTLIFTDTNITSDTRTNVTVTDLDPGYYNWHIVAEDQDGLTTTSETFTFLNGDNLPPIIDNSSMSPNGVSQEDGQATLTVNVSDPNFPADEVNVSITLDGQVVASGNITSNSTVTYTTGRLDAGTHTWNVTAVDSGGLETNSINASFDVVHHPPVINNSTASPQGGIDIEEDQQLSIEITDEDFDDDTGDAVLVNFTMNGELIGQEVITSDSVVTHPAEIIGGINNWSVEATDTYNFTTTSEQFQFSAVGDLEIRNETNHTQLVENSTAELYFERENEQDLIVERDAPLGIVSFDGLPANEDFVVVAKSNGYYNRRIYVDSLLEDQVVYMLTTNESAVQPTFELLDFTGNFPQRDSVLKAQRNINGSWETVEADFFGAAGTFTPQLMFDVRHRLILLNTVTDESRVLGIFTPVATEDVLLEVHPDDVVIRKAESPIIQFGPQVRSLPAAENVEISATFNNRSKEFKSYHLKAILVNDEGTTELFNVSGSNLATGETLSNIIDLRGEAGWSVTVWANWTTIDGESDSIRETFAIRESFNNQNSLLAVVTNLPSRLPSSTVGSFTAFITLIVVALATSYIAARASTEMAAFVGLAVLGGFMMIDWVPFGWFFVATVATFSLAALRRGL